MTHGDAKPSQKEEEALRLWRSLEESLASEAPVSEEEAGADGKGLPRRSFLQVLGSTMAFSSLLSCTRQPEERIAPYTRFPEGFLPGRPRFFASAVIERGLAVGVLVESHMGRPTRLEGHPDHPASQGALDPISQARIHGLYDPDRSQAVTQRGRIRTWASFLAALQPEMERLSESRGRGLALLTGQVSSPTLLEQIDALLERYPEARFYVHDPLAPRRTREGARMVFGRPLETRLALDRPDVVVTFDADFLDGDGAAVRRARDFARRRRAMREGKEKHKLYALESTPTITGGMADRRLPLCPSEIVDAVAHVARELGLDTPPPPRRPSAETKAFLASLVRDLRDCRQREAASLVIAGESMPPEVHALCHLLNDHLGNFGKSVSLQPPVAEDGSVNARTVEALHEDLEAGAIDALVCVGANPIHTTSPDLGLTEAWRRAPFSVHVGEFVDETAVESEWHLPLAHELETWSDARAYDGTITILQPLIEPLYEGRTAHQVLAMMLGEAEPVGYEIVRASWSRRLEGKATDNAWRKVRHDGFLPGSSFETLDLRPELPASFRWPEAADGDSLELCVRPDPTILDGRHANNAWLQELPKPMTRITWSNAVLIAPSKAAELAIETGRVVEVSRSGRSVRGAVYVLPGHAEGCVTVHLGYGRRRAGELGSRRGFDAYPLLGSEGEVPRVTLTATDERYEFATTQNHHVMEGRNLIRTVDVDHLATALEAREHGGHGKHLPSLYPEGELERPAWGMSIDLTTCTGCSSCVIACQAENNIPVVGEAEVRRGREMHWIRIDRYFAGEPENPSILHQPVPCMHCENAPCEVVCPVSATVHGPEGLNDMVYNRCVGTRYCSNNCPYKVRRFNFLAYSPGRDDLLKMQMNPDVTVRMRGVMEKCTYCVQRINAARIEARKEGRPIEDGEVVPACQSACPTQAIVFGDVADPSSRVAHAKADPLDYVLLEEVNARPRTSYLPRVRNQGEE